MIYSDSNSRYDFVDHICNSNISSICFLICIQLNGITLNSKDDTTTFTYKRV